MRAGARTLEAPSSRSDRERRRSTSTISFTTVGACDRTTIRSDRYTDSSMSWVTKSIVIPPPLHLEDEILELAACLGVDGGEGLVHQQDRGLVGEGAGDRDALLHAARELPRVAVDETRQPDGLERALDERGPLLLGELLVPERKQDVVANRHPGHQRAVVVLEDDRHLLRWLRDRAAVDDHPAGCRPEEPRDALEERRLAAARGADDADELAGGDRERDAAKRLVASAPLPYVRRRR